MDRCIAPLVEALNAAGVETVASCCGHGYRPGNVALRDGREIVIAKDFEQGRQIDTIFPTDIQGNDRSNAMTREQATEIARKCASEKPESYYAEPFEPHEWVIDAIIYAAAFEQSAFRPGNQL